MLMHCGSFCMFHNASVRTHQVMYLQSDGELYHCYVAAVLQLLTLLTWLMAAHPGKNCG